MRFGVCCTISLTRDSRGCKRLVLDCFLGLPSSGQGTLSSPWTCAWCNSSSRRFQYSTHCCSSCFQVAHGLCALNSKPETCWGLIFSKVLGIQHLKISGAVQKSQNSQSTTHEWMFRQGSSHSPWQPRAVHKKQWYGALPSPVRCVLSLNPKP